MWFDNVSAARAMLKLSRARDDDDLHQFIASSSSLSPAAAAAAAAAGHLTAIDQCPNSQKLS